MKLINIINRQRLIVTCLLALAVIGALVFKVKLESPNEDIGSLKSVSMEKIVSITKNEKEIPYEQIYDVGKRVKYKHPPIDWAEHFTENRSANFYLHSWDMINHKLIKYDETSDLKQLEDSISIALDWIKNNGVSYRNNQDETFAWYDMAVGVRAYRLAYVLDQAIRSDMGSYNDYRLMWNSLIDHAIYLAKDDNIIFHNNHGVYQAAGQKAMARRFMPISTAFKSIERQADNRLEKMINRQFSKEGVHLEHSPDYHRMVYQTFLALRDEGLLDYSVGKVLVEAGDAMYWMIKPDGTLVNFGDSDNRKIPKDTAAYGGESRTLLHYLTDGSKGNKQESAIRVFDDSGLGVVKSRGSYLAQQAAFHSRTHKHADDLTFNWFEGRDILIDSGKYGYKGKTDPKSQAALDGFWYADPKRQYVESTRAHNTVEIDGMDYLRRGRTPFGSAIVDSGKIGDNVYFIRTKVTQFETINQERILVYSPGEWLVVVDELDESSDKKHSYKQWFQFAPDLNVSRAGNEVVVSNIGKTALRAVSLLDGPSPAQPIRGQESPRLQGWYSKNANHFEPTTSLSFNQTGNDAEFVTLFTFSNHPVQVDPKSNTLDEFSWRSKGNKYTVTIDRKTSSTELGYRID